MLGRMPSPPKKRQSRKARTPIPRRVKEARSRLGLSQRELGLAVKLDESVAAIRVNQYERGVHTPIYSLVEKLAAVVGVPEAYFYASDDGVAEVIAGFGKLDEASRARVRKLIADLSD